MTASNGPTIRRAPRKDSPFTIVSKGVTENTGLSWQARGLLVYLLGKIDNWEVNVSHLQKETRDAKKKTGRDGIFAILDELMEAGYLQREQSRGGLNRDGERRQEGAFAYVSYVVHEEPIPVEDRTVKKRNAAANDQAPTPVNAASDLPDTGLPDTGLPDTGLPDTANPPLINNEGSIKNEGNEAGAIRPRSADLIALEKRWAPSVQQPAGLSDAAWHDFLIIRKSKSSVLTNTAMQRLEAEGAKAHLTPAQAVEYAAGRSWQTFTYAYWQNQQSSSLQNRGRYASGQNAVTQAAQGVDSFDDELMFS